MGKLAFLVGGMLLGASLFTFALAFTSKAASAQDPVKLAPENYKVILENDRFRVIDWRLKPGEKEPMHSHPFGVLVYYFSEAKLKTTFPDGRTAEGSAKASEVLWREPVTHFGENIGDTEAHGLLVEPKSSCK